MAMNITQDDLRKSFQTYRKDLLQVPFFAMQELLQHTNTRTGIRYREHVGKLTGNFEMGNYKKDKLGKGDAQIADRVFETFFGNLVEPIDPNSIYESIYGSNITKGDGLKNVPIVLQVATYIVKQIWEKVLYNSFTAKHDATNTTETAKWFNGFKTILDTDITEGRISKELGNLFQATQAIDATNAEDAIDDFVQSADEHLLGQQNVKLFINAKNYHDYCKAYQLNHGALPYNTQFDKKVVDGATNVEFVPLYFVPKDFMLLTPKKNIFCLYNQKSEDEGYLVERSLQNHYDVDVIANAFFGTQFEQVSKEMLHVYKKNEG